MKMEKIRNVIILHLLLFLYSVCSLCSKKASGFDFLSIGFIFFYGLMIALLGLYAIFWQQIIKKLPLTFAFANKAITVIWGMMWGVLVFHEHLSVGKFIGAAVIICGIVLFNYSGERS